MCTTRALATLTSVSAPASRMGAPESGIPARCDGSRRFRSRDPAAWGRSGFGVVVGAFQKVVTEKMLAETFTVGGDIAPEDPFIEGGNNYYYHQQSRLYGQKRLRCLHRVDRVPPCRRTRDGLSLLHVRRQSPRGVLVRREDPFIVVAAHRPLSPRENERNGTGFF